MIDLRYYWNHAVDYFQNYYNTFKIMIVISFKSVLGNTC